MVKQRVKTWWTDTDLAVKLLGLLLTVMIAVGGWVASQVVLIPTTYAKQAAVEKISLAVIDMPVIYARKNEVEAHKNKVECDIKEISRAMNQGFKDMGDKIDYNNQAVNEKIDKLMRLMLQNQQSAWQTAH